MAYEIVAAASASWVEWPVVPSAQPYGGAPQDFTCQVYFPTTVPSGTWGILSTAGLYYTVALQSGVFQARAYPGSWTGTYTVQPNTWYTVTARVDFSLRSEE